MNVMYIVVNYFCNFSAVKLTHQLNALKNCDFKKKVIKN